MPRSGNRKSKPKDEEVNLKRASKTKAQDQLKEDSGSSSESESSKDESLDVSLKDVPQDVPLKDVPQDVPLKDVSLNEPQTFDVTDDDDFNSSTILEILKESNYTSEDERAYESFMYIGTKYLTLADFVEAEIRDPSKRLTDGENGSDELQTYKGLAKHLADYSDGEFPQKEFEAFDIIQRWEQILNFTEPENWSVFSLRKACGIVLTFSDSKAQFFYTFVLLPRIRKDLRENGTLTNSHLSVMKEALKRKPRAFFKGVIIPLCTAGNCTLQEAIVFSSVLENFEVDDKICSMTVLLTIAELKYSGACSLFMKELLEQDLDLSTRIISAIIAHFVAFTEEERTCPVMWHECLLAFIENYKNAISRHNKKILMVLTEAQKHAQFTQTVQRKLGFGRKRR